MCYTLQVSCQNEVEPQRVGLIGPTAVGKTAVGVRLASLLQTEIVSADSMQVYRGMDVGTAKPTPAEQALVHFHGIDIADPDQEWTLADFQQMGESACAKIAGRGASPLVVGGTGLYIRALTTLLDIPQTPPDEAFRTRWRLVAQEQGNEYVRQELGRVDSVAADRIHVNDLGRLIRALEVYEATGVSLSEWHARNQRRESKSNVRLFGLNFADRRALYARIEARVDQMLAEGFVDEVRGLLEAGYGRDLKSIRSLGYRQIASYLCGEMTLDEAILQTKQETRHFARRQLIWFRADKRIRWLEAGTKTAQDLADEIHDILASESMGV